MDDFSPNFAYSNPAPDPAPPVEENISQKENNKPEEEEKDSNARFEMIAGVIIALFTAILALAGLAGDSYGQSILLANNEKASAYDWYSSKSIKQNLIEGQKEDLEALMDSGALKEQAADDFNEYLTKLDEISLRIKNLKDTPDVNMGKASPENIYLDLEIAKISGALEALLTSDLLQTDTQTRLRNHIVDLQNEIDRYGKEKTEILKGSANLDKSEWVQDVDGELGQVIGAQEWEDEINTLNEAGGKMDLAGLFLEIMLVLGAISLVMQRPRGKWIFLTISILVGLVGTSFMVWGMTIMWPF